MYPMHYVWPLEQAGIQESMWLLILISFCCLSSDPSSKIVTRTHIEVKAKSANVALRGCIVLCFGFFPSLPVLECSWTF